MNGSSSRRSCRAAERKQKLKKCVDIPFDLLYYSIRRLELCLLNGLSGSIAQLEEHMPYKHGVTGSSPVVPTIRPGSSVGLERQPVTLEVDGSSPFRVAICLGSSVGRAAD